MTNTTASTIRFEETDLKPKQTSEGHTIPMSAINATSIVTHKEWSTVVHSLIEQAHIRGNMPMYKTCITDMLRANGFTPIQQYYTLRDLYEELNRSIFLERNYIIKLGGGNYCALVPDMNKGQYVLKGTVTGRTPLERRWIEEIWLYVPGTDNRTGMKRKVKERTMPADGRDFSAKNMNPDGRSIGDCVIRGLSAAYDCTWHEAIDYIADATQYMDPILNITPNINATLIKLGFERHKGVKRGNKYINGKELCALLNRTYHNGETVFAYVGRSHCAAILPINDNGEIKYKVQDTWDSTAKGISEYWVYKKCVEAPKCPEKTSQPYTDYKIDGSIQHPQYGKGRIVSIFGEGTNRFFEIDFETVGSKKISEAWLAKKAR